MSASSGVEAARCRAAIDALAACTERGHPWTRRAFTAEHAAGRAWLAAAFRATGLAVRVDAAGNLIGRREGTRPGAATIMVGSHSDTVAGGGRFDGIAGVVAGLEIARVLAARGWPLAHTFEVVDFLAEEPNPYGLSCIGSRGMAGALAAEMLARVDPAGIPLATRLADAGAEGRLADAVRGDIAAFFELHIEQGPVLERRGVALGVVSHIVGIRRLALTFSGQAAHAGTTPYDLRRDALVGAAGFVTALRRTIEAEAGRGPYLIATVGELAVVPNAPNVVPGEVRVTVDLRSDDGAALAAWASRVVDLARASATVAGVTLGDSRLLSASEPARCDARLGAALRDAAAALGHTCMDLVSGAGHDAAFVARIAPAAMLFVPSRDGLSHAAEEWTDPDELAAGVATLLAAIEAIDAGVAGSREAKR